MDFHKLIGASSKENKDFVPFPYDVLINKDNIQEKKWVVFFSTCFRNIPNLKWDECISITNKYLDFIRKEFAEYEILYKPHPAETDEHTFLNLEGFRIVKEQNNAEIFLYLNANKIAYVFAGTSWAAASAYAMGINSYVFFDLIKPTIDPTLYAYWSIYFHELPKSFFLSDLSKRPESNAIPLPKSEVLKNKLRSFLNDHAGDIYFVLNDVGFIPMVLAVNKIVRELDPKRKLVLMISRHHRWDVIDAEYIEPAFDEVKVYPRIFYSLRFKRLWEYIKLVIKMRKITLKPEDIIFGFAGYEPAENAFVSSHKSNFRVGFWSQRSYNTHYNSSNFDFFRNRKLYFTPASFVYNKILEPLLGLKRTIFIKPKGRESEMFHIYRFQKPMNEIYDHLFIFSIPK